MLYIFEESSNNAFALFFKTMKKNMKKKLKVGRPATGVVRDKTLSITISKEEDKKIKENFENWKNSSEADGTRGNKTDFFVLKLAY